MRKILTIAIREYRAMVVTKAFLISIGVMPLLMFGGILAAILLQKAGSSDEKIVVVFDPTDRLYPVLANAFPTRDTASSTGDSATDNRGASAQANSDEPSEPATNKPSLAPGVDSTSYVVQRWKKPELTEQDRLELSDQIRRGEIYALLEFPSGFGNLDADEPARFYSEDAAISDCRRQLELLVSSHVSSARLMQLGLNREQISQASRPVSLAPAGLLERSADGQVAQRETRDVITSLMLPMGIMMLMFMIIFLSAQPSLESVLEEKSQRIAEVLLGSANAFQLMAGKLLGTVSGSLTVFAIYSLGTLAASAYQGWNQWIPFELIPWFLPFQILAVLFFSSIFMAVGASVSQLKEAQSMLLPVWMMMLTPMFCWIFAVREPNGQLATWISFFPPAIPTMMMLRLATGSSIPIWQPLLGMGLLAVCTVGCVFIAARIFRVGILWQGAAPRFRDVIQWGLFQ